VTARERDRECPRLGATDARDGSEPGRFSSRDEVAGARRRRRAKGAAMGSSTENLSSSESSEKGREFDEAQNVCGEAGDGTLRARND